MVAKILTGKDAPNAKADFNWMKEQKNVSPEIV